MIKNKIDKVLITKNNSVVDANNLFTWKIDLINGQEILLSEIIKIDSDEMMIPKLFDIYGYLENKQNCCFDFNISDIIVEEKVL